MKKTITGLMIAASLVLIGAFCFRGNFGRSYHHMVTTTTNLSEENIGDLYLGDKINSEKLTDRYGEILKPNRNNKLYDYYCLTDRLEAATEKRDSSIIRLIVFDENIKSQKGISIGDSKEKVIDAYGQAYYKRIEQGADIIGYIDKENKSSIEFWMGECGVFLIRYDYSYMA